MASDLKSNKPGQKKKEASKSTDIAKVATRKLRDVEAIRLVITRLEAQRDEIVVDHDGYILVGFELPAELAELRKQIDELGDDDESKAKADAADATFRARWDLMRPELEASAYNAEVLINEEISNREEEISAKQQVASALLRAPEVRSAYNRLNARARMYQLQRVRKGKPDEGEIPEMIEQAEQIERQIKLITSRCRKQPERLVWLLRGGLPTNAKADAKISRIRAPMGTRVEKGDLILAEDEKMRAAPITGIVTFVIRTGSEVKSDDVLFRVKAPPTNFKQFLRSGGLLDLQSKLNDLVGYVPNERIYQIKELRGILTKRIMENPEDLHELAQLEQKLAAEEARMDPKERRKRRGALDKLYADLNTAQLTERGFPSCGICTSICSTDEEEAREERYVKFGVEMVTATMLRPGMQTVVRIRSQLYGDTSTWEDSKHVVCVEHLEDMYTAKLPEMGIDTDCEECHSVCYKCKGKGAEDDRRCSGPCKGKGKVYNALLKRRPRDPEVQLDFLQPLDPAKEKLICRNCDRAASRAMRAARPKCNECGLSFQWLLGYDRSESDGRFPRVYDTSEIGRCTNCFYGNRDGNRH